MRVLVTGGRDFDDAGRVFDALDALHRHRRPISAVIQGGASGADALARSWANLNRVRVVTYAADWSRGRRAGPERNEVMIRESEPDLVVAFPGGSGTADAVRRAVHSGLEILQIDHAIAAK